MIKDETYIHNWIVNELGLFVDGEHYYPDYLPGEYDWRTDFDEVDLVIELGKVIAVRPVTHSVR